MNKMKKSLMLSKYKIKQIIPLLVAALLLTATSCSSDFLKEYSQDLSRVKTVTDLNELLMGDCLMPLGEAGVKYSTYYIHNTNYAVLHFMGQALISLISVGSVTRGSTLRARARCRVMRPNTGTSPMRR